MQRAAHQPAGGKTRAALRRVVERTPRAEARSQAVAAMRPEAVVLEVKSEQAALRAPAVAMGPEE